MEGEVEGIEVAGGGGGVVVEVAGDGGGDIIGGFGWKRSDWSARVRG